MAPRLIHVRQPRKHDLIGRRFTIAGFGAGFEATVLWRVLDHKGRTLGKGRLKGVGSMDVLHDFGHQVSLDDVSRRGAHVRLQVFGDDPSGRRRPGTDLNEIHVTLFTDVRGWKLYQVRRGDNLTKIAQKQGRNTSADDIYQANRDEITDPDVIFPGQVLRLPLRA